MYAFERDEGQTLTTYSKALWWTVMVLITMGSKYWPKSTEGQILYLLLAVYGFTVFDFFTGLLATYFRRRDAEDTEIAGAGQIKELQHAYSCCDRKYAVYGYRHLRPSGTSRAGAGYVTK
jgi:voltage-gated potassium channel